MTNFLKCLNFKKDECIARKGEPVDFFGIILHGKLRVGKSKTLAQIQLN